MKVYPLPSVGLKSPCRDRTHRRKRFLATVNDRDLGDDKFFRYKILESREERGHSGLEWPAIEAIEEGGKQRVDTREGAGTGLNMEQEKGAWQGEAGGEGP